MPSREWGFFLGLILFTLLLIMIPISPFHKPLPGRDSSVYIYIGQHMLDGKLPYRDLWDHKGPLLYFLNAFGLLLGNGSRWGLWWLEIGILFSSAIFGYAVMRKVFSPLAGFFGSMMWLLGFAEVSNWGNMVEEYSLVFQFGALFFLWRSLHNPKNNWNDFLFGTTMAASIMLRPNNIGTHLAILLYWGFAFLLLSERRREIFERFIRIGFGGAVVGLALFAYLVKTDIVWDAYRAVIVYNRVYSNLVSLRLLDGVYAGYLNNSPLFILTLTAWFAGWIALANKGFRKTHAANLPLLIVLLFGLPLEMVLSLISGRMYIHYYIAWLPMQGFLSALLAAFVLQALGKASISYSRISLNLGHLVIMITTIFFVYQPLRSFLPPSIVLFDRLITTGQAEIDPTKGQDGEVVVYILKHTNPSDTLIMWGNEVSYNLVTGRDAPSRFFYQYAFGTPGYASVEMTDTFLGDLQREKPLVIDTMVSEKQTVQFEQRTVPSLTSETWDAYPKMQQVLTFFRENYQQVDVIGPNEWSVYQFVGSETP